MAEINCVNLNIIIIVLLNNNLIRITLSRILWKCNSFKGFNMQELAK